jgi:Xaa-Pro aminopeptidase
MDNTKVQFDRIISQINKLGLDGYLLPGTDPHQSEYLSPYWNLREHLCGFTGSAGNLIFAKTGKAALFTDGRYTLQAKEELQDTPYEAIIPTVRKPAFGQEIDWLIAQTKPGCRLGVDPLLLTAQVYQSLSKSPSIELVLLEENFVAKEAIDRPALEFKPIRAREAGVDSHSRQGKLGKIRASLLKDGKVSLHLITNLEAIARILNLNGSDTGNDQLFFAYLLIGPDSTYLFCDQAAMGSELKQELSKDVSLLPYSDFFQEVGKLCRGKALWIDPAETSLKALKVLEASDCKLHFQASPAFDLKEIKTAQEMEQIARTHVIDGAALFDTFCEIRSRLAKSAMTEYEIAMLVDRNRARHPEFRGISFDTIAGYKGKGAVVHYRPSDHGSQTVNADGMLLIDSGGHYRAGTTDVTRTLHLGGAVSNQQKLHYTLVLKGHIAIAKMIFPEGTSGQLLDSHARAPLWQHGLDYAHGTGHGVGYGTCVHENCRFGISWRGLEPLREGNVVSNEPGYYLSGQYGIRIENLIGVVKADRPGFLKFRQLTMVPMERALVDTSLLTENEKTWLDEYHQLVLKALKSQVSPQNRVELEKACAAI